MQGISWNTSRDFALHNELNKAKKVSMQELFAKNVMGIELKSEEDKRLLAEASTMAAVMMEDSPVARAEARQSLENLYAKYA